MTASMPGIVSPRFAADYLGRGRPVQKNADSAGKMWRSGQRRLRRRPEPQQALLGHGRREEHDPVDGTPVGSVRPHRPSMLPIRAFLSVRRFSDT
jgi:glyoxylase-like metal-dependent hydrolase (beta-lactamase superfamily II)